MHYFDEFPEKTNKLSDLSYTNLYVRRLKSGLKDKNVQTIALLGSFGSGKSSIVSSSLKKKHVLYVYADNELVSNDGTKLDAFYKSLIRNDIASISPNHETYRKYIRAKKIIQSLLSIFIVFLLISIALSILLFYFSVSIQNYLRRILNIKIDNYWYFVFIWMVAIVLSCVKVIYIFNYSVSIKASFIGVNSNNNNPNTSDESIFTCVVFHLLRRKIKYIVFEDLDRTENFNFDSFIELRKICLRINASPQIKKPIKFIYCFSDRIFLTSDERLKSFDLIIPLIDRVTSYNAYEMLKLEEIIIDKNITDSELANLSIFIDDQRVYNSIIYEFKVICSQTSASDFAQIFALTCIKNLYPAIYYYLHEKDNIIDKMFSKCSGNVSSNETQVDNDISTFLKNIADKDKCKNPNAISLINNNAKLLLKTCIVNGYIKMDYKTVFNSSNIFLSKNDRFYLMKTSAMERVDPNLELTNFEIILKRNTILKNPIAFNISLFKYCFSTQPNSYLTLIINSLMNEDGKNGLLAILNSNVINIEEVKYLASNLYSNVICFKTILENGNDNFKNEFIKEKLIHDKYIANYNSEIKREIEIFYSNNGRFLSDFNYNELYFLLNNFNVIMNIIPKFNFLNENDNNLIINVIITKKRYALNTENLNTLCPNLSSSPLKVLLNHIYVLNYIFESEKEDLIGKYIGGNDDYKDLIKFISIYGAEFYKLINTNYLNSFVNKIDISQDILSYLKYFISPMLIKFSHSNLIQCSSRINNGILYEDFLKFIKDSIASGHEFLIDKEIKLSQDISFKLVIDLDVSELNILKDVIDTSFLTDFNKLKEISIAKIHIYEDRVILNYDIVSNFFSNTEGIQKLQNVLEECRMIKIDFKSGREDKDKLALARRYKMQPIYKLFKSKPIIK